MDQNQKPWNRWTCIHLPWLCSAGCVALERLWGDTPHPRAKEKPQQDIRHWSSSCMVPEQFWGDTPCPRSEKPQQDGRRGKFALRIKPHSLQRCSEGSGNLMCTRTQRPHRDWDWTVSECLLWRSGSAVDCCRGRGSGCSRPGYGISPLEGGRH